MRSLKLNLLLLTLLASFASAATLAQEVAITGSEPDGAIAPFNGRGSDWRTPPIAPQPRPQPQPQQPGHFLFAGDGLKMMITQLDQRSGQAQGVFYLAREPGAPFMMQLRADRNGRYSGQGQTKTPHGLLPFRAWESGEDLVIVEVAGRRFRLLSQNNG